MDDDDDDDYHVQSRNTAVVAADNISTASSRFDELMLEQTCGWSKCKPEKLQKLNSPKWFLFFLAVFSVAQGTVKFSQYIIFISGVNCG